METCGEVDKERGREDRVPSLNTVDHWTHRPFAPLHLSFAVEDDYFARHYRAKPVRLALRRSSRVQGPLIRESARGDFRGHLRIAGSVDGRWDLEKLGNQETWTEWESTWRPHRLPDQRKWAGTYWTD